MHLDEETKSTKKPKKPRGVRKLILLSDNVVNYYIIKSKEQNLSFTKCLDRDLRIFNNLPPFDTILSDIK